MANRTCILNPDYHSGIGLVQIECALSVSRKVVRKVVHVNTAYSLRVHTVDLQAACDSHLHVCSAQEHDPVIQSPRTKSERIACSDYQAVGCHDYFVWKSHSHTGIGLFIILRHSIPNRVLPNISIKLIVHGAPYNTVQACNCCHVHTFTNFSLERSLQGFKVQANLADSPRSMLAASLCLCYAIFFVVFRRMRAVNTVQFGFVVSARSCFYWDTSEEKRHWKIALPQHSSKITRNAKG